MFLIGLPIAYYAAKYGVDIDLLTRGAGFGYMGSTVTSLIYASFTFLLFAIEASIMSVALNLVFDIPMWLAHICQLAGGHSHRALRHQPHQQDADRHAADLADPAVRAHRHHRVEASRRRSRRGPHYGGTARQTGGAFNFVLFGLAASVLLSLLPQIGEQVDYLRFLPNRTRQNRVGWWTAVIGTGPGWVLLGGFKLLVGSFLAVWALRQGVHVDAGRRADHHVSPRVPRGVPVADLRAGADRHLRDRLPAQDQRDERLRRLDRLVELLLAPHALASGPRGVAGVQRAAGAAAHGDRHLPRHREHPGHLRQLRGRVDRRAHGRSGHQQAARLQPEVHRVQARAPLRHQSGRRRRAG